MSQFLHSRNPEEQFSVHTLFRTIADELCRRATNEWQPSSLADLCQKKGLSRVQFEHMLRAARRARFDPDAARDRMVEQLQAEGHKYRAITNLRRAWNRYELERMDPSNQLVQLVRGRMRELAPRMSEDESWSTLKEQMEVGVAEYIGRYGTPEPPVNVDYLAVALLWECNEHESRIIPQADPQPAEEAS